MLGAQVGVDVYSAPTTPLEVAKSGCRRSTRLGRDVVIIDTAGRLAIDEALMDEVRSITKATSPHYTFLVIDAVTGQDAVHTARAFHETSSYRASSSPSSTTTRAVARCSRRAASSVDRSSSPRRARRWTTSNSSTPTAWPRAFSAWATCSR